MEEYLAEIRHLKIEYETEYGRVHAVNDVSFPIYREQITGLVGESGSGKSMTALAIMGLLPQGRRTVEGEIRYQGQNLLTLGKRELCRLRNQKIGMIFQNPMSALNPVMTIGEQVQEGLNAHETGMTRVARKQRVLELLEALKLPDPERCYRRYPHELSGGMRQRVMIGIAVVCNPELLIADEPTTALDVTIQAQILKLLTELNARRKTGILLVSHDLAVIANTCQHIVVLYGGRVMEMGTAAEIFFAGAHPYTRGLLRSVPTLDGRQQLVPVEGTPTDGLHVKLGGCPFYERCPRAMYICKAKIPPEKQLSDTHRVDCWLYWKPEETGDGT